MTKPARLYGSDAILSEYREVLWRPELRIRKGLRRQLLQLIRNHSQLLIPPRLIRVTKDPDDDKFLECADAARADYLVTGNQQHFPKFWKKTKVTAGPGRQSAQLPQVDRAPSARTARPRGTLACSK
jgi:putative PIN family toxin of toxin-antitoxin system